MALVRLVYKNEVTTSKYANTRPIEYEIDENGCWNCVSHSRDKDGYCKMYRNNKRYQIHRYVYEREKGFQSEDSIVLHKCDNPSCINPNHLQEGTMKENMQDKVQKERQAKGSTNGRSKLTEKQVKEILLSKGETISSLSRRYGVSRPVIKGIIERTLWKYVVV